MPHEEKRQTVMWDYNNGLVRVTPFFKALEYPKTSPARMLGKNPGLKEICHSITGGSLAAQGYWMPFEAARAVATTFCYRIRYVLTPIFGLDFPADCIPPGVPGFDSMHVAPKIIRRCIEATQESYERYRISKSSSRPETPSPVGVTSWTPANAPCKSSKTIESESGYGTDTDCGDGCVYPPGKSANPRFSCLQTPRSVAPLRRFKNDCTRSAGCSLYDDESSDDCKKRKRRPIRPTGETDNDDDSSMTESSERHATPFKKSKQSNPTAMMEEERVALILVGMRLHYAALQTEDKKVENAQAEGRQAKSAQVEGEQAKNKTAADNETVKRRATV
ncbi:MAG: hypothetical protein Q9219_003854 [cf. Caloplaca sp. 3 TL-2023]